MFFIYGRGRSGSTLLVELLDCHPQVHCEAELLNTPVPLLAPAAFIRNRARRFSAKVYGFKLLSYQLDMLQGVSDQRRFFDALVNDGFELIYLYRRNILRHALSNILARRRGSFQLRSNTRPNDDGSITVEIDELTKKMQSSLGLRKMEEALLEDRDHLSICYEDDLENQQDHERTLNRIFSHLGLASWPVHTTLVKATTGNLPELLSNYSELREHYHNTPFAEFFE